MLALGQEHPALDLHERCGHDEELAGYFQVELLHRPQRRHILLGHRLDRDIVDVYLVLADQEKQQVERSLKNLQLDAVIGVRKHAIDCR